MAVDTILQYTWLIPVLPFVAFLVVGLFGKKIPGEQGGWLSVALVGAAGILSLLVFQKVLDHTVSYAHPFVQKMEWWTAGNYQLNLAIHVDPLTGLMLFVVGILVTLIVLYSVGYMHEEGKGRRRYFAEITLFITGMLGLVVAGNYLILFIFWEIMGLCSYLLIGYWYKRPAAAAAAKKAFLVTRIGDVFFLVGILILLVQFGGAAGGLHTLDFDHLFSLTVDESAKGTLLVANLFIFLGAVGKSAQFPLHVWLPDAMEGPTTVSALIHAATMVKAGVYLVARSYPLMVQTPELLLVVAIIGGFTALFAASMALVNNDVKRVLAYSTLSQLGYMFLALGVGGSLYFNHGDAVSAAALAGVTVAIFHLFSHAFFKAGLFLSAGSVGHARHHEDAPYDMREMGGMRKWMPVTAFAMLFGTISIAGLPPFSGFYSKDALLEAVYHAGHDAPIYYVLYGIGLLTALMTAYYMFRLYFMTFEGEYRGKDWKAARDGHFGHHHDEGSHASHIHESGWTMTVPLAFLGAMALVGGAVVFAFAGGTADNLVGASPETLHAAGLSEDAHGEAHGGGLVGALIHPFTVPLTYASIAAAVVGAGLAYAWWGPKSVVKNLKADEELMGFSKVLANRYYIDQAYNAFAEKVVVGWARVEDWFDQHVIDGVVNGVAERTGKIADRWRFWQTGDVQDYTFVVVAGLVVIILAIVYAPLLTDALRERGITFFGGS